MTHCLHTAQHLHILQLPETGSQRQGSLGVLGAVASSSDYNVCTGSQEICIIGVDRICDGLLNLVRIHGRLLQSAMLKDLQHCRTHAIQV